MCSDFDGSVKEVSHVDCYGLTITDVGKHDHRMQTHQASDNFQVDLDWQSQISKCIIG